jgi:hypothetical protein
VVGNISRIRDFDVQNCRLTVADTQENISDIILCRHLFELTQGFGFHETYSLAKCTQGELSEEVANRRIANMTKRHLWLCSDQSNPVQTM